MNGKSLIALVMMLRAYGGLNGKYRIFADKTALQPVPGLTEEYDASNYLNLLAYRNGKYCRVLFYY